MPTTEAPTRIVDRAVRAMGGGARARILLGADAGEQLADDAVALVERRLAELEQRWSRFRPDSDLSRLSAADGRPLEVHPDTIVLLAAMRAAWHETDHDFDPSLLPALVAGGYARSLVDDSRATALPPTARDRADLDAMRLDGTTVTLPSGTALDSGGIGKGLAADLIADELLALGVDGCLIEVGGDVRVRGTAPDGIAWRIRVEDPFDQTATRAVVRLGDGGIATSSQRKRRWLGTDGADAHHLIDPATLRSASTSIQTVTVVAATAARAESLTKPGFLRPLDDYLAWLPTRGAAALLIDADGLERTTPNWSDYA